MQLGLTFYSGSPKCLDSGHSVCFNDDSCLNAFRFQVNSDDRVYIEQRLGLFYIGLCKLYATAYSFLQLLTATYNCLYLLLTASYNCLQLLTAAYNFLQLTVTSYSYIARSEDFR